MSETPERYAQDNGEPFPESAACRNPLHNSAA